MAYDKIHGPSVNVQDVTGNAPREWGMSGTDAAATVAAAGFITDGYNRGMRAGDTLLYRNTSATPNIVSRHEVLTSTLGAGVDLSDGTILSATNAG